MNTAQFAKSAAMLGNSEDHTALSRALSQLAEVEEKIDQLHQEQANADFYLFSELLGDYVRLITAVKVRNAKKKKKEHGNLWRVSVNLQTKLSFCCRNNSVVLTCCSVLHELLDLQLSPAR